jgi:hypothetical protein
LQLSTLKDPLTIIDPKQISLEYIELVHVLDKVRVPRLLEAV